MFKIKHSSLLFTSNKRRLSNSRVLLFFYGLGCSTNDLNFVLKNNFFKSQVLIAELPGHNNLKYNDENLYDYSRKIFIFLKKNKVKEITFFAHSIGGIVPILIVREFLKKKIKIKNFINYEGNLTEDDTKTLTKKTISYKRKDFILNKFDEFINRCTNSNIEYLSLWSKSVQNTSALAFYDLSKECVKLSETNELLKFFRIFFKKKVYISGEKTKLNKPESTFGSIRYKIKNCGHFSYIENKLEFSRILNRLILKKI